MSRIDALRAAKRQEFQTLIHRIDRRFDDANIGQRLFAHEQKSSARHEELIKMLQALVLASPSTSGAQSQMCDNIAEPETTSQGTLANFCDTARQTLLVHRSSLHSFLVLVAVTMNTSPSPDGLKPLGIRFYGMEGVWKFLSKLSSPLPYRRPGQVGTVVKKFGTNAPAPVPT